MGTDGDGVVSLDELARRYRSGEAVAAIAAATGVPGSTVYKRLRLAGVDMRPRGVPHGYRRLEIPVPDIVERYRGGDSINEIARSLGVSTQTVRNRLIEAGVERRQTGGARRGGGGAGR